MLNLGYLPGGDHAIRTQAESSLDALQKSLKILNPGGIVSLVFYPGHSGGREELELIKDFLTRLPQNYFEIMSLEFINQVNNPPRLIVVRKIKEGEDETAPAALHN
jgi:glyoxylase-like metal-dependent hydrolase (beta-lactamase superfamily II)